MTCFRTLRCSIPFILGVLIALERPAAIDAANLSSGQIFEAYDRMREEDLGSASSYDVKDVQITVGEARIVLSEGILSLTDTVVDKPWGAVFLGKVLFYYEPSLATEGSHLKTQGFEPGHTYKAKSGVFFLSGRWADEMVGLCSSKRDGTPRRIRQLWTHTQELCRRSYRLNIEANVLDCITRNSVSDYFAVLLEDVAGPCPPVLYEVDGRRKEPVTLYLERFDKFHMKCPTVVSKCRPPGTPPDVSEAEWRLQEIDLDLSIGTGDLKGEAVEKLVSARGGVQMIPVELPQQDMGIVEIYMEIENVKTVQGNDLPFISEGPKEGSHCWIVLDRRTMPGDSLDFVLNYKFKRAIDDLEMRNYVLNRPATWYPRAGSYHNAIRGLRDRPLDFIRFHLTADIPRDCKLVATGICAPDEGASETRYECASDVPVVLPSFAMGQYEEAEATGNDPSITVYVNKRLGLPLFELQRLMGQAQLHGEGLHVDPDEFEPRKTRERLLTEASSALQVLRPLFGPLPGRDIHLVQHPDWTYAYSMSDFAVLPPTSSWTPENINKIYELFAGRPLDGEYRRHIGEFRRNLVAHEVAHQWLGCLTTPESYHDYWLIEGFATYAAILVNEARGGLRGLLAELLYLSKEILNSEGSFKRANDVGPISLGPRLTCDDAPGGYSLVYNKGAYVLHMLRMLMHDDATDSDVSFLTMCKDFVDSVRYQTCSTDDFQRMAERYVGADLGWFFNQWINCTAIPEYSFGWKCVKTPGGQVSLMIRVEQSEVGEDFQMPVRYVIAFADGDTQVGSIWVRGTGSAETLSVHSDVRKVAFLPLGDVLYQKGKDLKL